MRRILVIAAVLAAAGVIVVLGTGASGQTSGDYRVRAVFDNAFSIIKGEDVRVAGVNVGKIESLDLTPDNRAAVVLNITRDGFKDFRKDAKCTIRPQSLIGEKYVECTVTQPRPQGAAVPPALEKVRDGQPGAGQYLLPVDRTSKPVDVDLVNNITRLPQRQRLAIILNELGAAVAGRGQELNETIRRANPALAATDDVLKLIGQQNDVLRRLATDSDAVLAPLARDRAKVADFIVQSDKVNRATAARSTDLQRNLERLPRFLSELRPTMVRLSGLSQQMAPVFRDLGAEAPQINRFIKQLGPFSQAGIPAVTSLGDALQVGRPALTKSKPILDDIRSLTGEAAPLAKDLGDVSESLRDSGGIERLMDYLFYQVAAINGYDSLGHYLRAGLIVNTCTTYTATPQPGCSARYAAKESTAARASAASAKNVKALYRKIGADQSAQAMAAKKAKSKKSAKSQRKARSTKRTKQRGALKLPASILPGASPAPAQQPAQQQSAPAASSQPAPAQQQSDPQSGPSQAQQGLLDYLLGGGG